MSASTIRPQPGDVIVWKTDSKDLDLTRVAEDVSKIFPQNYVLVLGPDEDLLHCTDEELRRVGLMRIPK